MVAFDVAITGHQTTTPLGQPHLGLEFSEPADYEHLCSQRDPSTEELAGGPGNGSASGERLLVLCFALPLFIT